MKVVRDVGTSARIEAEHRSARMPARLFGFDVIARLGEGAGSRVYLVTDPLTRRRYALKHVVCRGAKDARFIEQLRGELEVSGAVKHPALRRAVALHSGRRAMLGLGPPREAALLLELVEGRPVETPMPRISRAIRVLLHVARALGAMHAAGYVHCDLKPQNVLVDRDGRARLIDLGQACRTGTVKTRIQGTPDFIAPEQVRREPVTEKTDAYGWGATAYTLLTGRALPTLYTVRRQGDKSFLLPEAVPSPMELRDEVPAPLSELVLACVRSDPARRPAFEGIVGRLEALRFKVRRERERATRLAMTMVPALASSSLRHDQPPAETRRAG